MSRSDYRTQEQRAVDAPGNTASGFHITAGRWAALALILGAVALTVRVASLRDSLNAALVNPSLLKSAMSAVAGTQVPGAAPALRLPDRAAITGIQARALSIFAQAAGHEATAEVWLVRGLNDPASAYLSQFELCRLYWSQGEYDRALDECRETVASATYWLDQGYAADQDGDLSGAIAYFQMAATVDPDLLVAWHQLGRALFAAARFDEAIPAYEQVLAFDATPPADVYDSLGRSYLELHQPKPAREIVAAGLNIYPVRRELYLVMAETYRAEGDLEMADEWYARMLQRWPDDAQAWAARGKTATATGRLEEALDYYRQAANNKPDDLGYWLSLAETATATGNVAVATEAYDKAMTLRPADAVTWFRAGRFLADSGQIERARIVLERVLQLQPDNSEAADELAALMEGNVP